MRNWKTPGKDGIQGYWVKNLSNVHEQIAIQTNKILMRDDSLPAWMTRGSTVLCQKDPRKGNVVGNSSVLWTRQGQSQSQDFLARIKMLSLPKNRKSRNSDRKTWEIDKK